MTSLTASRGLLDAGAPPGEQAARNFAANLNSMRAARAGAATVTYGAADPVEWLFARDGSLTAMLPADQWWAGCSVPRAAARFMLKKMDAGGNVACFLSPMHAAQVRVALDKLEPHQAIVAIVPEARALWMMLHCEDFSTEIANHRLWFAAGENWETDLEQLFVQNPGLPTPAQFIRPILADSEQADWLIAPAQKIFAAEGMRRAEQIRQLVSGSRQTEVGRRVCLIAPGRFRLWDPAPTTLAAILHDADAAGVRVARFDSDDPASASPLALASAIADCDAVVAANVARADVPEVAPREVPWITWVTMPRVPGGDAIGPKDRLLVTDPDWRAVARERGWPVDRIDVAAWPRTHRALSLRDGPLVLIADTEPLDPPKKVEDFSSHKLLWEMIGDELLHDPFAIGDDVQKYLMRRISRLQIAEAGFDRGLFVDRLIVPAYQQGLARLLVREAFPLKLHGKGWDHIEVLSASACGPVLSLEAFDEIVSGAAGIVHPWPMLHAHPIDAIGRPLLRAFARSRDSFLRDARTAIMGRPVGIEVAPTAVLSWKFIASLLAGDGE